MELERERTPGAANGKQPETVVVGVGLGGSEGSALRAFQAEVEESTLTRWLEASTVDGALARLRRLHERGAACVGLVSATLGDREVVRLVRSLCGPSGLSPVVVVAGRSDEPVVTAAMLAGACDFVLVHEIDADCLVRSIRFAAQVAQHEREAEHWRFDHADLELRFGAIWDLIEDGLLLVDEQLCIRRWNRAAKSLLGLADADLDGTPFGALRWTQSGEGAPDAGSLSARELPAEFERPDGSRIRLGLRVRVFPRHAAPGGASRPADRMRAVLLRDRRETDEHAALLAEARHFAGLGRLLAGAAHDGNNLLTPLLGYCDLLLAGLPPGSDLERYAQEIERSARRTSDLLRRLLERSRGRPQELRPVLADRALADLAGLLRSLVGSAVELEEQFGAPGLAVALRDGQVEQLVLNLVANARDALPGGGKLALRTVSENGRAWALEVADSGIGIPVENLDRLFDPNFTTKAVGKGTGLGLWIVRSIVQEAGGRIRITSRPGKGTTVRIELPTVPPGEPQAILER
ncbi:MAG: two-component system, cell cycle sensor histidine kinase and response regulator CckA [Acidobacteriota bacterium]|nr:two-component system, cell cycle sensor histidine kinase and response regulator CckA [Acidobacteriota bacterium]